MKKTFSIIFALCLICNIGNISAQSKTEIITNKRDARKFEGRAFVIILKGEPEDPVELAEFLEKNKSEIQELRAIIEENEQRKKGKD